MSTARRYASCRHAAIQCLTDRPSLIPAPPYGSERDLWVCAPQLDADNFPDICERFKIIRHVAACPYLDPRHAGEMCLPLNEMGAWNLKHG